MTELLVDAVVGSSFVPSEEVYLFWLQVLAFARSPRSLAALDDHTQLQKTHAQGMLPRDIALQRSRTRTDGDIVYLDTKQQCCLLDTLEPFLRRGENFDNQFVFELDLKAQR